MEAFVIERKINLPLEKVWMVMGEFNQSRNHGIQVVVEKEGDPGAYGAGMIRTLTKGDVCVREILDSVNPPDSIAYRIIDNPFMDDYHGRIFFKDENGATIIS